MSKHQRYANRKPIKYTRINALSAVGMVYVQPGFTARLPGFGIRRIQHLNNVGVVRDRGLFGGDMKYTTAEIKEVLKGFSDLLAENERLSALAAQELLVEQERKRVARECAEMCEPWGVADRIRTRYGVEE